MLLILEIRYTSLPDHSKRFTQQRACGWNVACRLRRLIWSPVDDHHGSAIASQDAHKLIRTHTLYHTSFTCNSYRFADAASTQYFVEAASMVEANSNACITPGITHVELTTREYIHEIFSQTCINTLYVDNFSLVFTDIHYTVHTITVHI